MPCADLKFKPALTWRRDGRGWLLLSGRRRLGRVMPDPDHPGMWRSPKSRGEWSDIANLTWAKNAVLHAAERELEFEGCPQGATDPTKCPEKRGLFGNTSAPIAPMVPNGTDLGGEL